MPSSFSSLFTGIACSAPRSSARLGWTAPRSDRCMCHALHAHTEGHAPPRKLSETAHAGPARGDQQAHHSARPRPRLATTPSTLPAAVQSTKPPSHRPPPTRAARWTTETNETTECAAISRSRSALLGLACGVGCLGRSASASAPSACSSIVRH